MVHEQEYTEELRRSDQEEARTGFIKARELRGFSQEVMAEKAGYSITQYERIENGERVITGDDLWKVAKALIDYDDSLKSPFHRKLTKIRREINSSFQQWPEYVVITTQDEDPSIIRIRLSTIAIWCAILLLMKLTNMPYNIGYTVGRLARLIELAIT